MKVTRLETREVEVMPKHDDMEDGVFYLSRRFELGIHLCACGCRQQTVTPLDRPTGWDMTEGPGGVTLRPSIGNQRMPCRSHYWITNGAIEPCA